MAGYPATVDDIAESEIVAGASAKKERGIIAYMASILLALRQLILREEDGLCREKRTIDPSAMTAVSSGQIGQFLLL